MSTTEQTVTDKALQKRLIFAWVDALRSGEFEQGSCALENYDGCLCCLGVACRVYMKLGGVLRIDADTNGNVTFDGDGGGLPDKVREAMGIPSTLGSYGQGQLSEDNDCYGKTFPEIADIIEANAARLFTNGEEVAGWLAERKQSTAG